MLLVRRRGVLLTRARILLELEPQQDPVSIFLESQHEHIKTLMRKSFDGHHARVSGA